MNLNSNDICTMLDEIERDDGHAAAVAAAKRHAAVGRTHAQAWLDKRAKLASIGKSITAAERTLAELGAYESPFEKLEKGLRSYCEAHKIARVWTEGLAKFATTPEGKVLKAAYDADPTPPARPEPEVPEEVVEATKRADAIAALESGLMRYCKARGINQPWTVGLEQYRRTPEGRELSDAANGGV